MKNLSIFSICCIALLVFTSCSNESPTKEATAIPDSVSADTGNPGKTIENIQKKLEQEHREKLKSVPGSYIGVLPCADCEGIKTMIVLNPDNTFLKKTAKQGKKERTVNETKGSYNYDPISHKITLSSEEGEAIYLFKENHIVQLDKGGKEIKSEKTEQYRLKKMVL